MITTHLPIARTDSNGTTWYPAADGMGWTSQLAFAAPHVLADAPAVPVLVVVPAPVTTAVKSSHAACLHATTRAARKVCRAARKIAAAA